jgi:hypothetical protein
MTRKALERWETKISNAEVTPQAIWPIVKTLKRDGSRALTAIHGASGLKFHPSNKANEVAVLGNSVHMICVTKMNGGWRLKFKLYWKP